MAILRRHLLEKVPISDLCEEHGLHPMRASSAGDKSFSMAKAAPVMKTAPAAISKINVSIQPLQRHSHPTLRAGGAVPPTMTWNRAGRRVSLRLDRAPGPPVR